MQQEFLPQHDSFELYPEDQLLASALHEPPYTSPKGHPKHLDQSEQDENKAQSESDEARLQAVLPLRSPERIEELKEGLP